MKSLSGFFFVLIFSITLYSQPLSTKTIDGNVGEWENGEKYQSTWDKGFWLLSWDSDYIYLGFEVTNTSTDGTTLFGLVYFDTDPQSNPLSGGNGDSNPNPTTDVDTSITLPFLADFEIFFRNNSFSIKKFQGSEWVSVVAHPDIQISNNSTNYDVEMRIPRSFLGNPSELYTTFLKVNSTNSYKDGFAFAPYNELRGTDKNNAEDITLINPFNYFYEASLVDGVFPFTSEDTPLPVELSAFTASAKAGGVELNWTTASEVNNNRFEVERKSAGSNWIKLAQLNGAGNSSAVNSYRFFDKDASVGSYSYRLKQVDNDGKYEYSKIVEVIIAGSTELLQNYPNPFNPTTTIRFTLAENTNVKLTVYNLLGQEIGVLINQRMDAGSHNIKFDASNLISGVYLYKIEAGGYSRINKMLLIK